MKKPNIVFLDSSTVDLNDLDLSQLKRLGNYRSYPMTSQGQIIKRARKAGIIVTNKCVLGPQQLASLPQLKLICVTATGVNNVDLSFAKSNNIAVCNVKGYSTTTVAEHTLMFILALSHRLLEHRQGVLDKKWSRSSSFTLLDFPFLDLKGKILGIVGYGNIGKKVAGLAKAFGMKVLVSKTFVAKMPGRSYLSSKNRIPLNVLLRKSDFVTLHCPLTKQTYHLIGNRQLKLMKPSSYLVNTCRGSVVDTQAIFHALKKNWIAGYATDVLNMEPPQKNHLFLRPSLKHKILITPHVAWASKESRQRVIDEIVKNIQAFKTRKKRNRVC